MASSQSLPSSLAAPPSSPTRNKPSSQLPLPTTLNTTMTQRPQGGTTVSSTSGPSNPPLHSRSASHVINRPPGDPQIPASPTFATFSHHMHSSTHAGGIQPSMSFFRPSRPNNQSEFSRPSTAASADANRNSQDPEFFQLADVNRHSESFDDDHLEGSRGADQFYANTQGPPPPKRLKQSREPLLPLVDRPSNPTGRPSTTRDRSGTNTSFTPKNIMRTSFDKVMGLSRGLSFDSIRRSPSTKHLPVEGRTTFEGKRGDEENGFNLPRSPAHYERTSPSILGDTLGVHRRHSVIHTSHSPSPDPSFIPQPPDRRPPLSAVPILNPETGTPHRKYELHPSNNKFFFRGHMLTGGDSPLAFITSFLLVLSIAGVWFGTTCVWWWQNESPAVAAIGIYMALLVISSMLATATTDPGILPRDLDPDPPCSSETPSDGGSRVPMPRDLKVRNDVVRTKYCSTCRTYRPPRSSHCKMCDNCVDGCDHHCQWVNNCVGRRNYTTFFVLLLSATLTLILIICTSALHLYFLTSRENMDFQHALRRGAGSVVAFCLSVAIIWPVAALLLYHMRLLLLNITTIEQIRNQAHKSLIPDSPPPNPFSHGSWRRNLVNVLCRPQGYSWLDASAIATEDKREVNPGLIDGGGGIWDGSHN